MASKSEWTNSKVAQLLKNVSDAYVLKKGNRFKIMAYDRAASSIKHSSEDIKQIWKKKKLTKLPGVGSNIAAHLDELFKTGKVKHFEKVFKGLPESVFELTKVSGIGPKVALKLSKGLKIKKAKSALKKLKKAAKKGKVREFEGFGEKSEQEIITSLKEFKPKKKRMLLYKADHIAGELIEYLKKCPQSQKIHPLGSLRRRVATVGDIDISVGSNQPQKVIDWFTKYPEKRRVIEAGTAKAAILVGENQIDLRVEPLKSYGSLLQHFTGSKQHNIHLRELALKKGLSLSEHGIKRKQKLRTFESEKAFYNFLGLAWIPPELREDKGEIEASQQKKLPNLIKQSDIKGDLHIHSNFKIETSHDRGTDSIKDIAKKSRSLGYKYIALSEHNPSISRHNKSQIISIIKRKKDTIDKLNSSNNKSTQQKLFIFNSLEVDIRPNGDRAIPDQALDFLDFIIVSVHSSFRMTRDQTTKRILKGLNHPKAKILGHPTGRMLGRRQGCEADWSEIFAFCKKHNKFLEINSFPERLDLPAPLVRQAIKSGVKLVINSDYHSLGEMEYISYGVDVARRGWAKKSDIINTLQYNQFKKLITA